MLEPSQCHRFALVMLWLFASALTIGSQAVNLEDCQFVDLTHEFGDTTVYMDNQLNLELEPILKGELGGVYVALNNFRAAEHAGTHMDAPSHFNKKGIPVNEIPFKNLIGEGCVVDISAQTAQNRSYAATTEDFLAWETKHGQIHKNCILILSTGWSQKWHDREQFLGSDPDGHTFPGMSGEAAQWLAGNREFSAFGIDTPSIDPDQFKSRYRFSAHVTLAKLGVPNLENLANTHLLPARGSTVVAMPIKIKGGTGGPLRAFAYGLWEGDPCSRNYRGKVEL